MFDELRHDELEREYYERHEEDYLPEYNEDYLLCDEDNYSASPIRGGVTEGDGGVRVELPETSSKHGGLRFSEDFHPDPSPANAVPVLLGEAETVSLNSNDSIIS